uniref:SRP54 domain-containing protein n=1 Tax=Pristionchus pacificus TaxID=54126 RepID=A0A2A6CZI2_PRIPA
TMIELFTIFGKGGIVLWCFQEGAQLFTEGINNLIKEVIMQERGDVTQFKHQEMTIKFKLDNEFDLVFIVVYQSIIQLSYADKLISEVEARFRDLYKNVLENKHLLYQKGSKYFKGFGEEFDKIMESNMRSALTANQAVRVPKTFQESAKSQKTIESMIISRPGGKDDKKKKEKEKEAEMKKKKNAANESPTSAIDSNGSDVASMPGSPKSDDEDMKARREAFFSKKKGGPPKAAAAAADKKSPVPEEPKKKGKAARVWELSGKNSDSAVLDYSSSKDAGDGPTENQFVNEQRAFVGKSAALEDLRHESESEEEEEEVIAAKAQSGGWFSAFKGLVGNKKLTADDMAPVLEKMKENLILKNVAAEPADQICQSVAKKLDGKVISTFSRVNSEVKEAVRESLTQLLTPRRRVDILRDVAHAKSEDRPYVIVFCGVNGVGKSTNLAKITFWLNENGHKVLIAAGDTFRAGAVEQLRTHTKHLNALHPNSVQLYEQGYGKDAAELAKAAIAIAQERKIDVVLVDTAGRMQDNEPLMRALSKLIRMNKPDLTLFVGEALVGNEAVDQLVRFNQALADHTSPGEKPLLIDGMVLTKFDTIDDKVGAAISMTYITGQPIVFVGCGQTYKDLRNLNVSAVVNAILK